MRPDLRKDRPMAVRGMRGAFIVIGLLFAAMIVVSAVTGRAPDLNRGGDVAQEASGTQ